jgi:predicted AlkP superfamily pyrophosphatase or phosphodiesterase
LENAQDHLPLVTSNFVRRPPALALVVSAALVAGACHRHHEAPPAPRPAPAAILPAPAAAKTAAPSQASTAPVGRGAIKHVVIISEDGLRPDALMGVRPPVHEAIFKKAAYSLQARTIRHASTLPSHAAMLSGFDVKEHGLYWNSWKPERGYIQVPTIFDAAEKSHSGAVAFVGKQKLKHIAHPGSVDVFSRPGYFCKKVVDEATRYFVEKRPQIEFIHFSDPDDLGHSDGWMSNPQLDAIRHTDQCLATLLDAVAAAGLDRETLFIISADHGGHGHNHDGKIKEDRLIPWIAWGPGVRAGHRIQSDISTVDTAATALWALGYPATPGAVGRPVLEAFEPQIATAP